MSQRAASTSVTDRLRRDILSADLAPGTRLLEIQLAERYAVGRAAIRAAFLELDKEGLVIREVNRGATVRSFRLDEAIEVYEARAALEGLMARHAATRASDEERARLRSLAASMRRAVESNGTSDFLALGRDLHEQINQIGRHSVARGLIETLRNQSRHHPDRVSPIGDRTTRSLEEHLAIIEAIVAGNGDAAERAARTHIDSIIASLR